MNKKHLLIVFFISALILSSCREFKIHTVVNKDGSFTRIVTVSGDSAEVYKPGLPYPVDETWAKNFSRDTSDKKKYILTYTKSFANSDGLNQEIAKDTGWRKDLDRVIEVKKKFGFFYSYLSYHETIKAANPFVLHDYHQYISDEDMRWLSGEKWALNSNDSLQLDKAEDHAGYFMQKAVADDVMGALNQCVTTLNDPNIPIGLIEQYRDSIAQKMGNWSDSPILGIIDSLSEWTQRKDILQLKTVNPGLFEEFDRKFEFLVNVFLMDSYSVSVEMPGLLTETNSPSIQGSRVNWKVTPLSILLEDLHLNAESRVVNKWMFFLAGIILLLFIGLTIYKARK